MIGTEFLMMFERKGRPSLAIIRVCKMPRYVCIHERIQTPENVPRLYDLIKTPNSCPRFIK